MNMMYMSSEDEQHFLFETLLLFYWRPSLHSHQNIPMWSAGIGLLLKRADQIACVCFTWGCHRNVNFVWLIDWLMGVSLLMCCVGRCLDGSRSLQGYFFDLYSKLLWVFLVSNLNAAASSWTILVISYISAPLRHEMDILKRATSFC